MRLALLFALTAATPLGTAAQDMQDALADHPQWRRLGHYVSDTHSDVLEGPGDFFLAPDGASDPAAELRATVAGLTAPAGPDPDAHAQCRFPARYAFLREHVAAVRDAAPVPCPALDAWRAETAASGASVVFASGHLSNPASFYGHILLRLDRDADARDGAVDLFDQALNYGAIYPEGENGLLYIVRGLTGAYPSGFSRLGFYTHKQRWAEEQLRDAWVYELDLDAAQLARLSDHAWELRDTQNRYYFAKQNCAWRIAELVGVAAERDMNRSPKPWAMPADVLAELTGRYGASLVRRIEYLPSRETRTHAALAAMGPEAAGAARALIAGGAPDALPEGLGQAERAAVLDLAIDRASLSGDEADPRRRALLLARLGLPPGDAAPEAPAPPAPHTGQRSTLLRLFARHNGARGEGVAVRFRGAYYDLLTVSPGTARGSELTLIDAEADLLDGEADLRRVEIFRVTALNTNRTGLADDDRLAWRVRGGAEAATLRCQGCLQGYVEGGAGHAVALGDATVWGLAGARAAWPDRDLGHARFGGSGGVLLGEDRPLRALFEGGGWTALDGGETVWSARGELRYGASDTSDLGLAVEVQDTPDGETVQVDASWSFYF